MSNPNSGGGKPPDYAQLMKLGYDLNLKYAPKLAASDLALRQQFDPQFIAQQMGLQEQFDPRLAQEQYDALNRRDPQWVQAHQVFGDKVIQALQRGYIDPNRAAAYKALGQQVTGDTLRGTTADPRLQEQMQQAILARSPQLSSGAAQDMAAAVYTGQRGQQLQAQRQQANLGFLGQQSENDLALTAGGRYMSTPGMVSMENQIGGVQAPRALAYMNPNAGTQAASFGLANYPAQLQASQSSNPWMNALQGAAQGASYGSYGGGYGMAGGALTGAVAGAFGYPQYSDSRWKKNISRTGALTKDGIPIVEFEFNDRRWVGVLAQDVQKVRPDAVYNFGNGRLGVFYSRLGIELRESPQEAPVDALQRSQDASLVPSGMGTAEIPQNAQEDL